MTFESDEAFHSVRIELAVTSVDEGPSVVDHLCSGCRKEHDCYHDIEEGPCPAYLERAQPPCMIRRELT
jgi:hypothetical protein